jgi:hypothetical protein
VDLPVRGANGVVGGAIDPQAAPDPQAQFAAVIHGDLVAELQRHGAARSEQAAAAEPNGDAAISADIEHTVDVFGSQERRWD